MCALKDLILITIYLSIPTAIILGVKMHSINTIQKLANMQAESNVST